MKHIFDEPQNQQNLLKWARDTPICVASFFFWGSGTDMQKSQVGLLRSLLFQVLSQEPQLIPSVLPEIWSRMYSDSLNGNHKLKTGPWSVRQLMSGFSNLVHQSLIPLKIFFLIDGLDEFEGDHEEISTLFKDLTRGTHNIKICVSSRPWQVFEDIFSSGPMLRLQYMMHADIHHFVTDRFTRNSGFCKLTSREPDAAPGLIGEVADRADGVFLSVQLVVNALLNGIRNRDDMATLRLKLRALPRDIQHL